jgi:hypothetical protein
MKLLGLLGLPLLAIAVAVMVFSFNPTADTTEAATDGAELNLAVDPADDTACPGEKVPKGADPMVCVGLGQTFTLQVNAAASPQQGYILAQTWINYGDLLGDQSASGAVKAEAVTWPDCTVATFLTTNTDQGGNANMDSWSGGCLTDLLDPVGNPSFYKGTLFTIDLTCPATPDTLGDNNHIITQLAAGTAPAGTSGAQFTDVASAAIIPDLGNLEVNCVPGPTDTPTSTPPPVPRMQKCDQTDKDMDGEKDSLTCENLVNVFLTRQSTAKVPPDSCLAGKGTTANAANFAEKLSAGIVSPDPKDPEIFQQLAAFEFEVHYDNKKVCVDLTVGDAFAAAGAICVVEDSQPDSKPQLEGVARMGCVTVGKGHAIDELEPLALVDIYPQPEIYSPMKPNQDNGNVVQINNVNCDLGDEQGHAIPIFSCDDADVTFRYLEGDVEPDCVIDVADTQAIAFRWGVEKGSLIYKDFMNLEPSSQQQDNDIDINDLQFVFGRFGSTCNDPHPVQDPVNPKA